MHWDETLGCLVIEEMYLQNFANRGIRSKSSVLCCCESNTLDSGLKWITGRLYLAPQRSSVLILIPSGKEDF